MTVPLQPQDAAGGLTFDRRTFVLGVLNVLHARHPRRFRAFILADDLVLDVEGCTTKQIARGIAAGSFWEGRHAAIDGKPRGEIVDLTGSPRGRRRVV